MRSGVHDVVKEAWDPEDLATIKAEAEEEDVERFRSALARWTGAKEPPILTRSGREALTAYLMAVAQEKPGTRVMVSAFNCTAVPDAVRQAGFEVDTFDLRTTSGAIDWEHVGRRLTEEHLAVVVPHLFGVPTDFRPLRPFAAKTATAVVEDCAQTLGGTIGGAPAGSLGDAAIFSFHYDKPLSLAWGGALQLNRKPASPIGILARHPSAETELAEIDALHRFLRKRRAHIARPRARFHPAKVAQDLWQQVGGPFTFDCSGIGEVRARLGILQLQRWQDVLERRNRNAQRLASSPLESWHVGAGVQPAWLKQKIHVLPPQDCDRIAGTLRREGFHAGRFNWQYVLEPTAATARRVSLQGLDVPVHQGLDQDDMDRIAAILLDG